LSFLRHEKIYQFDGLKRESNGLFNSLTDHRSDESSAGYSFTSCSPAELMSASPVLQSFSLNLAAVKPPAANPNCPCFSLSQARGPLHSQPSLRDCSWLLPNPGLTSWATLSRPFGTQFVSGVLTQGFKALHILRAFAHPVKLSPETKTSSHAGSKALKRNPIVTTRPQSSVGISGCRGRRPCRAKSICLCARRCGWQWSSSDRAISPQ